ncbi:oligosaccharide flippase family protein [bacterium]|nr:oligosaccharide flippase family protein [bacterium]
MNLRDRLGRAGMHVRVGNVFAVIVAGALLQVLIQIVIARGLPVADVGLISLILGALPLFSTLTLLGQDASIVRHFSKADAELYDLNAHARKVLGLVVPLGAAVGLAGGLYYGFPVLALAVIITLVAAQNVVLILTALLRARHRYERAIVARHLPIIGSALLLAWLFWSGTLRLESTLVSLLVAYAVSAVVTAAMRRRPSPAGASDVALKPVDRAVIREGLLFLGVGVSFSVMVSVDKLVISKIMGLPELAVYSTVFSTTRAFDFLFYAISFVLMPTLGRVNAVSLRKPVLAISAVAVAVTTGYLLFGEDLVHLLFAGRYDAGSYLIPAFVLSGMLKLFYSIPSSYIGGRAPTRAVRQFMVLNLGTMVLNVALDIVFVIRMGLLGAAIATAIAWGLRLLGGLIIMQLHRGSTLDEPLTEPSAEKPADEPDRF